MSADAVWPAGPRFMWPTHGPQTEAEATFSDWWYARYADDMSERELAAALDAIRRNPYSRWSDQSLSTAPPTAADIREFGALS